MNPEPEQRPAVADAEQPTPRGTAPPNTTEETLAILRRTERILGEIRGHLESSARTQRHQDFSFPRLLGAICQAAAAGLVVIAVAGWTFRASPADQLIALALAGVLQLGALTAFVLARSGR